ncbi:hypothetical protein IQ07DRAFT_647883 [Pyrenochaeta sp. DS3sAY3a]|nr:hypothetical protein IQ07DRAFT_647883 [Pyrenochaeta sp. DS3sAY3a]
MGDAWWGIGSKESGAIIKSVTTLLLVNEVPRISKGVMVINSALENSNRHDWSDTVPMLETYQTLTVSYPPGWNACDQKDDQWCMFPSLYNRHSDPQQYSATARALNPMTALRLNWNYNGVDRIQLDAVGTGISNLTIEAPWQWWPKTECQCGFAGVIPAHSYVQTEITLMQPVSNWGSTADFHKANASIPTSDDGGLTWKIDSIDIEDSNCESDTECPI